MEQSLVPNSTSPEDRLTSREKAAVELYVKMRQPPMAASTQAKFFELFLNGSSCEEIVRLNPNGFPLGAIVRARIENDWDLKRDEHLANLMEKVRERTQQVQLETIDRINNELAASNKLINDKAKRFLQSNDPAELDGTQIGSMKHLREMAELLLKLTGQDTKKSTTQVAGTVEHRHTSDAGALPVPPANKPFSAASAASYLEIIHKKKQGS